MARPRHRDADWIAGEARLMNPGISPTIPAMTESVPGQPGSLYIQVENGATAQSGLLSPGHIPGRRDDAIGSLVCSQLLRLTNLRLAHARSYSASPGGLAVAADGAITESPTARYVLVIPNKSLTNMRLVTCTKKVLGWTLR
ncbi:hypothetical protein L209DRAFT_741701 [Thermothelomyces heterothallicus CBS 203.75]